MTVRRPFLFAAAQVLCPHGAASGNVTDPFATSRTAIEPGQGYGLASVVLGAVRRINISLPGGYDDPKQAGARYPVLYLLDRGIGWQDFAHITAMVRQGELWGANAPIIVVGIESKDRRSEFTRPSRSLVEIRDFPTHGNAEAFHEFLVTELRPAISRRYRTTSEDGLVGGAVSLLRTRLRWAGYPA